jgi:hypothetical protein
MMAHSKIQVEQALFGYRDGHRLLQASRGITADSERALLTLTDMSGPRMMEGFEDYLSGYPMPGDGFYVFARTWYAPEMERPGCVWSHALMIRNENLSQIAHPDSLLALFRHPSEASEEYYLKPTWIVVDTPIEKALKTSIEDIEQLIALLYTEDDKAVIIPAPNSRLFEPLILSIWAQQWPELRSAFRFSTGSLSNRSSAGHFFDLQVIPSKLSREFQRNPKLAFFTMGNGTTQGHETDALYSWVRIGASDIFECGSAFRTFIWKYAESCAGTRLLYRKLAELFAECVKQSDSLIQVSEITQRVHSVFPEAECGVALKNDLYAKSSRRDRYLPSFGELACLTELATTSLWPSFNAAQFDLRSRAEILCKEERQGAEQLLLRLLEQTSQPLADEIIAGFVEGMSVSDACLLAQEHRGLLLGLVARNPRLVLDSKFWNCNLPLQTYYNVLDYLQNERASEQAPAAIWISSVLESGEDQLAGAIVERFGTEAVRIYFERASAALDGKADWIPTPSWRTALTTRQHDLQFYLKPSGHALSNRAMTLLAGLLDAHDPGLNGFGIRPWVQLVSESPELIFEFPNSDAAAFLLSLGFQRIEPESVELVKACFENVHDAAADDSLSYRGWQALKRELPTLSWSRDWDKCERLRQGLLQRFIRNHWSRQAFLPCVSKPEIMHRVLHSCRDIQGGEKFILSIVEDVFGGISKCTEGQLSVLQSAFRRNWLGELRFRY